MINQIIVPCHVHPVHLATHLLVEGERVIVEESQCPSSSAAVLCKAAMIMTEMREREREREREGNPARRGGQGQQYRLVTNLCKCSLASFISHIHGRRVQHSYNCCTERKLSSDE